jgi:hypothetical protein
MFELPVGDQRHDQISLNEISKEQIEQLMNWDAQLRKDIDSLFEVIS